jgi:uncharacterized damage-inducible protein DinB
MEITIESQLDILEQTSALRYQILDALTDSDLHYRPTENNVTLWELFAEMGGVQMSYTESFKTFKQDWAAFHFPADAPQTVEGLRQWCQKLDAEMVNTLKQLSPQDAWRTIDRGFTLPLMLQIQVYREALVIFCGKGSIYLKALKKPFAQQFTYWIG